MERRGGEPVASARLGAAALAGGVAMAFALLVVYLLSVAGVPFAPSALGQAIIEALPGWISVPLIELLQFWAQRLLVVGVLVVYLAAGVVTGLLAAEPRAGSGLVTAVGALPWAATVALGYVLAGERIDVPSALLGSSVGAAAFLGALASLVSGERVASPTSLSRRRALIGAAAVAGVLAAASIGLGSTARALRAKAEPVLLAARRLRAREPVAAGDPAFEEIAHLEGRITPNERHYTVDTALVDPRVDVATWELEIAGHVERPYAIGHDELLDLEAVERPHTLECISNEIGGDLISTAVWTGVPMADLLARATPRPGAFDVVLTSVDGYTDSIPIAKALEPDTLVAYLMNGYTLPEEHGHPARALIPGIYGMKNVKWLARIEVVTFDFLGYWMERGWSDAAIYNTHVRIDAPADPARLGGGPIEVAGIAFAGSRGIGRVEVSTDGGRTWEAALLEAPAGRHTWRRWRYAWTPAAAGRFQLAARATDGDGQVQTPVQRAPFPAGSTGYHVRSVGVVRG